MSDRINRCNQDLFEFIHIPEEARLGVSNGTSLHEEFAVEDEIVKFPGHDLLLLSMDGNHGVEYLVVVYVHRHREEFITEKGTIYHVSLVEKIMDCEKREIRADLRTFLQGNIYFY
tara:strand:+ start:1654 stop:2001 length:348 start_codon:yes stop_codon:yes gene_type:complete